jgi:transposase InsO family protein
LYARFETRGENGVTPDYDRCGQKQTQQTPDEIVQKAQQLRNEHVTWGAELIRLQIDTDEPVPVARTLQRWFKKNALPSAPPGKRPQTNPQRATQPHEIWQMDGKEYVLLKSRERISWLRVVDEFTGAVLGTFVFQQERFASVSAATVQKALRALFSRWGRPQGFRVDNGHPWGSIGDFPTDLSLWLIGLGLQIIWNPPCQPQKNGVVERSQGVGKNWAEPRACDSAKELQKRLDEMDRIQREEYPYQRGKSRLLTYPQLKWSRRRYDAEWEAKHWSMKKVLDHLSEYVIRRRVDRGGSVSIYNQNYYVGKHYRGEEIYVYLDPLAVTWVFSRPEGEQLRVQTADRITQDRIMRLEVTKRRRKPK